VRGLLSSSYFVDVILPDLKRRYRHVGHWLLDAADYGVPQHRRRVFVWAGPAPLVPPTRTHGPGMFTQPWVTMREVLQLDGARVIGGGRNPQAAGIERTYRDLTDEPSTCVTAVQIGNARPWIDLPAPTITSCNGHSMGSANSRNLLESMIGRRRLYPQESSILQGFPDGYPWHACRTKTARYRAIGNAVPPALAQAVAQTVLDAVSG
jgi:DNA (cytosine-5)-methyltransferase 1